MHNWNQAVLDVEGRSVELRYAGSGDVVPMRFPPEEKAKKNQWRATAEREANGRVNFSFFSQNGATVITWDDPLLRIAQVYDYGGEVAFYQCWKPFNQ